MGRMEEAERKKWLPGGGVKKRQRCAVRANSLCRGGIEQEPIGAGGSREQEALQLTKKGECSRAAGTTDG